MSFITGSVCSVGSHSPIELSCQMLGPRCPVAGLIEVWGFLHIGGRRALSSTLRGNIIARHWCGYALLYFLLYRVSSEHANVTSGGRIWFIHISHNTCHLLKIISTANIFHSLSSNIQTYFPFLIKDTINRSLVTNILIPVIILWFHTWVTGPTDPCSGHLLDVSVIWFMIELLLLLSHFSRVRLCVTP